AGSRARAPPRRCRGHGQFARPQDQRRARSHREGRSAAPVPAALLAGLQPDRDAFSKLKALLRKAAARTVDELWSVVADCLSAFTPEECRHYFEAAGYDPD